MAKYEKIEDQCSGIVGSVSKDETWVLVADEVGLQDIVLSYGKVSGALEQIACPFLVEGLCTRPIEVMGAAHMRDWGYKHTACHQFNS